MDTQARSHTRRRIRMLPLWSVLIAGIGLAGCHGEQPTAWDTRLLTRTDKFFDVAHTSGDTFVAVGYTGRILRSEDAGKTWVDVDRPVPWSLNQLAFQGDHGWAVGHNGTVIHTRDGGKTWTPQHVETDKVLMAVSFSDKLHGWACGDESTTIWTENGGETWNVKQLDVSQVGLSPNSSLAVPDIIYYGVQFIDDQNGWLVGEYGNIRHTADGGKTWDSQHSGLLDQLVAKGGARDVMTLSAFFNVHFSDPDNGVLVGGGGAIAVTNDGGAHWRWVAREGDNPQVPPLHLYDITSAGKNGQLLTVGMNAAVFESNDGGLGWKPASTPEGVYTWINGIAFNEAGKGVLVGGKGTIMTSADGGETWQVTTQTEAELPEASVEEIEAAEAAQH